MKVADALLSGHEKQKQSLQAMFKLGEANRLALLSAQFELLSIRLSRLDTLIKAQQSLGPMKEVV